MQSTRWKKQIWMALKMVAPGTVLREGIENVLRAKTGGLIVLSDAPEVRDIAEGGFHIDEEINPARLYELAKMDGAIILDEKCKNIWCANVQLQPTVDAVVQDTGIRHRIAARTAIQTNAVVIAISQRRSTITLYKGNDRFVFDDAASLMSKANQALRTLERYCIELQKEFTNLTYLEFEGTALVSDVVKAVQRCEMVLRICDELDFFLLQMGEDGALVEMQKDELTSNVTDEYHGLLADYALQDEKRLVNALEKKIGALSDADLLEKINLARELGFGTGNELLDLPVCPRGYRILGKVPRLPQSTIGKIVEYFNGNFHILCNATVEDFDEVDGVGRVRSNMIYRSLERQKDVSASTFGQHS